MRRKSKRVKAPSHSSYPPHPQISTATLTTWRAESLTCTIVSTGQTAGQRERVEQCGPRSKEFRERDFTQKGFLGSKMGEMGNKRQYLKVQEFLILRGK